MRLPILMTICVSLVLTSCTAGNVSANEIPTPTPFQPGIDNASDSVYDDAAPTPLTLPAVTLPTSVPTEAIVPTVDPATPTSSVPPVINPLTGLPASNTSLLNRNPMAIKVANYPRYVRPQSGLTLADQVFEYYIEGGLTRFIAVFYGNDSEWVGPVRSGRFFDEHIVRMYHAYLIFKFADKRVLEYFKTTDIAQFLVTPTIGSCPPYHLMSSRDIEAYNNNYFNTIAWADCVAKHKLPNKKPFFRSNFSDVVPAVGNAAAQRVFTDFSEYSYHYWEYDPDRGVYLRFQETNDTHDGKLEVYTPLMDNVTGEQVNASNVIVLFAYHTFANPFNEDDEVYQIDLTGTGEAYVFRDGIGIPAIWNRLTVDQPLILTTNYGEQIPLKPGITFYEVIGTESYASQGDGEWFFHHETP